ncbi:hypothetical protein [Paraburkholderia youngii]|uniref:Uncharacterized protein n=1 Tax=Paraburkholderia youngii TaxID=2782701 RepID=A0A7Y6N1N4_9BURK|nr:hypothetical protein [Paraburkholderia youngii]NUY02371.1 hypothetical protein [Paraburkholderia youngii]
MRAKSDQIFQLSLTEIAFTLAFILMLLLGYMLVQADEHAAKLQLSLDRFGQLDLHRKAFDEARKKLSEALSKSGVKPDDVITSLVAESKLIDEREALKRQVDELDKELSALTEVKKTLDAAQDKAAVRDDARQAVTDALALKASLEKQIGDKDVASEATAAVTLKKEIEKQLQEQLGESYASVEQQTLARDLVAARKEMIGAQDSSGGVIRVTKENADLRGQVAFLKARLDARGGRDYPPCWADEQTGKVEFLFTIEIGTDGLRVTPAWPEKRQSDAMALPGASRFKEPMTASLTQFSSEMQGIDRISKEKNCRHYVYIKNRVTDLGLFNRSRYAIENFFYKLELRS